MRLGCTAPSHACRATNLVCSCGLFSRTSPRHQAQAPRTGHSQQYPGICFSFSFSRLGSCVPEGRGMAMAADYGRTLTNCQHGKNGQMLSYPGVSQYFFNKSVLGLSLFVEICSKRDLLVVYFIFLIFLYREIDSLTQGRIIFCFFSIFTPCYREVYNLFIISLIFYVFFTSSYKFFGESYFLISKINTS